MAAAIEKFLSLDPIEAVRHDRERTEAVDWLKPAPQNYSLLRSTDIVQQFGAFEVEEFSRIAVLSSTDPGLYGVTLDE